MIIFYDEVHMKNTINYLFTTQSINIDAFEKQYYYI